MCSDISSISGSAPSERCRICFALSCNAADYVVWRKTIKNEVEYNIWRNNFGRTFTGSGANSPAVPEPTTLLLATLAAGDMARTVHS